jgi:hypothetical protein
MKYYVLWALLLCGVLLGAETRHGETPGGGPLFDWSLLWAGAWDEGKTINNRGDLRLGFPLPGLVLRGQAIDKRPLNFELDPPWGEPSSGVSAFSGGLYHRPTGSRLLYGVLDEWGLSARVRNPWLRSAPFAENHRPLMADLKTTAAASKEPEAYLYLSSPELAPFPGTMLRGFASAQTGTEDGFKPDFSGGIEAQFGPAIPAGAKSTGARGTILLEGLYTGAELPARTGKSWFSDPPPLPEREFNLYALGLLVNTPYGSVSSDWAYSETFAQGRDMYGSLGLRVNPPAFGTGGTKSAGKGGPWSLSLAADSAGGHFTGRDGVNPGAGFRTAGKIEWKGGRNSLFRINTGLRGPGIGENFNRSSSGVYYRFPAPAAKNGAGAAFPLRVSRLSLGVDRNAEDPGKIIDGIDGTLGLSLNLPPVPLPWFSSQTGGAKTRSPLGSPLGINISGSLKGHSSTVATPSPYPQPQVSPNFDSARAGCELVWSPGILQFKTKLGYTVSANKADQADTAFSAAVRFKHGRLGVKIASPDFPGKWNYTVSWRLEKK